MRFRDRPFSLPPCPQLHFARGFRFVGHLVVIVFRILFVDIVKWGAVYLIIVPGFGITFFLLVRDEWVSGRGSAKNALLRLLPSLVLKQFALFSVFFSGAPIGSLLRPSFHPFFHSRVFS